jgi:hypothetical protein
VLQQAAHVGTDLGHDEQPGLEIDHLIEFIAGEKLHRCYGRWASAPRSKCCATSRRATPYPVINTEAIRR